MQSSVTTRVKVETVISKGLLTYVGLSAAFAQYATAVAVYLDDTDKITALGPLGTATATLLAVIAARTSQAKAAIQQAVPFQDDTVKPTPESQLTFNRRQIPEPQQWTTGKQYEEAVQGSPRDLGLEVPGGGIRPRLGDGDDLVPSP